MEMSGEARIGASPETVWAALTDPSVLCRLISGCESMTGDPLRGYDITVAQGVGTMRARLSGRLDLTEVAPGRGCLIHAEGRGGAAGLAAGTARIRFLPEPGGTRLTYAVEARLGGRLARVPGFVVRAVARRMVDTFFARFAAVVEGPAPRRAAR
jgi:carbon monoxide dehydrogenase subunit G